MRSVPLLPMHARSLPSPPLRRPWLLEQWPLALAFALPLIGFWLQKDVGLSLLDEGFVWYGAQRVLQGEVPLRDFQAYDIGRYWWYAAWMWLMGSDGIVPLRAGSAVLAGCTVALMLLLLRTARRFSAPVLAAAVATFALWMIPYFKVADSFATILLLAGLAKLVTGSGARNWLQYGLCLGLAATIGINHAFYGVLAAALFLGWARWHGLAVFDARRLACAVVGVGIGYAPVIGCHLLVPGFAAAFVDTIRLLFEAGTTNLGRPVNSFVTAWSAPGLPLATALREFLLSAVLLALAPAFLLLCVWRVLQRGRAGAVARDSPVFVAAVIACVADAHYVVSRADLTHLSVSVLPLLLAAWTWPIAARAAPSHGAGSGSSRPLPWSSSLAQPLSLLVVFVISAVLAAPAHALYQRLRGDTLQPVAVGDELLRLSPADARELQFLQRLRQAQAPPHAIYVVPYWPGAYAALRVRAPVWEIYTIFPATAARQRREIQRLRQAGVTVAVVQDARMDWRADLGFAQTHPLIAAYLANCMDPVTPAPPEWMLPPGVAVFVAGRHDSRQAIQHTGRHAGRHAGQSACSPP